MSEPFARGGCIGVCPIYERRDASKMGEDTMIIFSRAQSKPPTFTVEAHFEKANLEVATALAKFPWLLPAIVKLRDLERDGRYIAGIGDLRIGGDTADSVRQLLSRVNVSNLPVPEVVPISGGGVGLMWESPSR